MKDPVGVTADPRPVLMMGDEPDTVAELMLFVDSYAMTAYAARSLEEAKASNSRKWAEAAIRAALEAQ